MLFHSNSVPLSNFLTFCKSIALTNSHTLWNLLFLKDCFTLCFTIAFIDDHIFRNSLFLQFRDPDSNDISF